MGGFEVAVREDEERRELACPLEERKGVNYNRSLMKGLRECNGEHKKLAARVLGKPRVASLLVIQGCDHIDPCDASLSSHMRLSPSDATRWLGATTANPR